MSRLEPDEDLRQRYAAMEDRLSVSVQQSSFHQIYCVRFGYLWVTDFHFFLQIVRKRLNRPMTLAEKVSCTLCCGCCSYQDTFENILLYNYRLYMVI